MIVLNEVKESLRKSSERLRQVGAWGSKPEA